MKKIKILIEKGIAREMSNSEMREERINLSDEKSWTYCGVTGVCPDGHKVSCVADSIFDECYHLTTGADESGAQTLIGVKCGNTVKNCNPTGSDVSGTMPQKVKVCLYKREWDTCEYMDGLNSGTGWCQYENYWGNPWRNYLTCSDLFPPHKRTKQLKPGEGGAEGLDGGAE